MLIDFLLNLIYQVIVGFLGLFPTATLSDNIYNATTAASSYLSAVNTFIPVSTLIAIISLYLTIEGIILIIKAINWFIRKIPTID